MIFFLNGIYDKKVVQMWYLYKLYLIQNMYNNYEKL